MSGTNIFLGQPKKFDVRNMLRQNTDRCWDRSNFFIWSIWSINLEQSWKKQLANSMRIWKLQHHNLLSSNTFCTLTFHIGTWLILSLTSKMFSSLAFLNFHNIYEAQLFLLYIFMIKMAATFGILFQYNQIWKS